MPVTSFDGFLVQSATKTGLDPYRVICRPEGTGTHPPRTELIERRCSPDLSASFQFPDGPRVFPEEQRRAIVQIRANDGFKVASKEKENIWLIRFRTGHEDGRLQAESADYHQAEPAGYGRGLLHQPAWYRFAGKSEFLVNGR